MSQEPVHPAIVQAAWSAIGAVPGCTLSSVTFSSSATPGSHARIMTAELEGWSPSLHKVRQRWQITMDMSMPPVLPAHEIHARRFVRGMRSLLAIQQRRAQEGLSLGSAIPLRADGGAPSPVNHCLVDASFAALAIIDGVLHDEDLERTFVKLVGIPVSTMHSNGLTWHNGGDILEGDRVRVWQMDRQPAIAIRHDVINGRKSIPGSSQYATIVTPRTRDPKDAATMHLADRRLILDGFRLPESVLLQLPGRTVADVVDVPEALGRRRILRVKRRNDEIILLLERAMLKLGDLAIHADTALAQIDDILDIATARPFEDVAKETFA